MDLCTKPETINLCVVPGATFRHTVQLLVGETEETATPVDLSGATAEMDIRSIDGLNTLLHAMNTTNGGIVMDADGNITFFISKEDSSAFDWDQGEYESLEITYANGDVEAFSRGKVSIGRELTK